MEQSFHGKPSHDHLIRRHVPGDALHATSAHAPAFKAMRNQVPKGATSPSVFDNLLKISFDNEQRGRSRRRPHCRACIALKRRKAPTTRSIAGCPPAVPRTCACSHRSNEAALKLEGPFIPGHRVV